MLAKSMPTTRTFRLLWWPAVAAVLLLSQAVLSVTVRQSRTLTAYALIFYFLGLVLATGIATLNAVQNKEAIRLFWSFVAMAFGAWSLSTCGWMYYMLVLGRDRPAYLGPAVALTLHIVFMIAGVASRPHLKFSPHRGYRTTLNFLLLLFFWVFAYAFLWVRYSYTEWSVAFFLRGQALYLVENFLLLAVLGVVIVRAQPAWKSIYLHLLGASALYILGSSIANYHLAGRGYYVGLKDIPLTAAACWFVWVALRGRKLAPQLAQSVQPDTGDTKYTSLLAMLAVVAVPIVGVWELFRVEEPYRTRVIRLLIVLLSVLCLAVFVFLKEYLANRELSSDVGVANERLRSAMESGKAVGWEWDLKSGRDAWFGDLKTMFGIPSDTYVGRPDDFYRYVHPEDRQQVAEAVADAKKNHTPYAAEFRVVWPDGTLRWVSASGKFYYSSKGEPERMLGMAVDITDRKRAQDAVREIERRYRRIVETSNEGIWLVDAKFHTLFVNQQMAEMFGYEPEEMLGHSVLDFHFPEDLNRTRQALERPRSGVSEHYDNRFRRKDGSELWVHMATTPILTENGEFDGVLGMLNDVSQRRRAEAALRESEARELARLKELETLLDAAPITILIAEDAECKRITANRTGSRLHRVPIGSNFSKSAVPAGPSLPFRIMRDGVEIPTEELPLQRAAATGIPVVGAVSTLVFEDGTEHHMLGNAAPLFGEDGKPRGAIGAFVDITDRRRAEEARRESEERLHLAFQAGGMYAYEWDPLTDRVTRSAECINILGKDEPLQITRRELSARVHPDDREQIAANPSQLTPEHLNSRMTYRVLRHDGSVIWLEKNARAFFDDQGRMLRTVGVVTDITARKHAEEALRESEDRLGGIVASAMDAIIAIDDAQRILVFNTSAEKMFGCRAQDAIGSPIERFIPQRFRAAHSTHIRHFGHARTTSRAMDNLGTLWALRANGDEFPIEASISHVNAAEKKLFTVILRDITDRRRAEEALRESEERFRLVANTAPVMIWMSGTDKLCTFFNQGWLNFTGRSQEQEFGDGWISGVHPDDLERCLAIYSGSFDARVDFQMEYRLRRFDGVYRWIVDFGVPRFEADGAFCGFIGSCVDITERKSSEESLQAFSGRLIRAQEEERARIARELHDDFSQRLALLGIGLGQLLNKLSESEVEERTRVLEILKGTQEMSSDLHSLSHQLHSSKLEHVGLASALRGLCKEISEKYKVQVQFTEYDCPPNIPKDVALCLFRVVQEALTNVVKHSQARSAEVELSANANGVSLRISDAGMGFDPGLQSSGSGIGLIGMTERLRLVSGRLSVKSELRQGTEILAEVPLAASAKDAQGRAQAAGK